MANFSLSNGEFRTVGWVSDPEGRGTSALLVTCLVTLGLCVWSAVHLSIPKRAETPFLHTLQYVKWSIMGVFGPELVVFAAWRQYISAQALLTEVKNEKQRSSQVRPTEIEKRKDTLQSTVTEPDGTANFSRPFRRLSTWIIPSESPGNQVGPSPESRGDAAEPLGWSMAHGFYAGMGGFVFDLDGTSTDRDLMFLVKPCRLTLTARAVALLCRCGLLPQIQQSEILDKSKSDGLAKSLACLQAGWMVIQVIARLRYGLPITLLEVNTLGHVFCAFVIYLLWWNKPKYIKEPTRLDGEWVKSVAAFMYISSKLSGQTGTTKGHFKEFTARSELSALAYIPANGNTGLDAHFTPKPQHGMNNLDLDKTASLEMANLYASVQNPTSLQLERWRLAAQAVTRYPAIRARFDSALDHATRKNSEALRLYPEMPTNFKNNECQKTTMQEWLESPPEQLVTDAASNWPDDDLLRGVAGLMMGVVLWFASMAFGAVHAAAWECYFPTLVEAWLWRSSACYIVASGLLWLVANMLSQCSRTIWWYWYDMLLYQKHWLHYVAWGVIFTVFGAAYVFARLFLVVEAFISLRSLPVGAYKTPEWANVIPHL